MDIILRALGVYLAVLTLMRLRGKRHLGQLEAFDLVLLLIVSEATQQAMLGDDFSVTNGVMVVTVLLTVDQIFELIKQRSAGFRRLVSGAPTLLMDDGELLRDRMRAEGIDEDDILQSGRTSQGLERLDQMKYVVLERNGTISVIPRS